MRISVGLQCTLGLLLLAASHASASGLELQKAYVGLEGHFYPNDGFAGQDHGNFAATSELEFGAVLDDHWSARLTPFFRADATDSSRNGFDLREAAFEYTNDRWKWYAGMGKVSWSVTETVNIIPHQVLDIINQRDMAGDTSGQEKLGAAMMVGSYQGDTTIAQLYVLPWFRKRVYPDVGTREHPFEGLVDLNDRTEYASPDDEYRTNFALRIEKATDAANIALIQYQGYAPQPVITPNFATGGSTNLYYLVNMTGLTVQATLGSWLLKTETAYFDTRINPNHLQGVPDNYFSTVTGVEYTFVRAMGQSDLGVVVEWIRDTRGNDVPGGTPFAADMFMGFRWVANDADDAQILGGLVRNASGESTVYQIQYEQRLLETYWLHVEARTYEAESGGLMSALRDDTVVYAELRYYF